MKPKTLGEIVAGIRAEKGMTMLETAIKCDLSEATIWKVEAGRPVRWETVHAVVTVFHLKPHDPTYQTLHHLWLKQRHQKVKPEGLNKRILSKHAVEATRKFRIMIRDLNPEQTKKAVDAMARVLEKISKLA